MRLVWAAAGEKLPPQVLWGGIPDATVVVVAGLVGIGKHDCAAGEGGAGVGALRAAGGPSM